MYKNVIVHWQNDIDRGKLKYTEKTPSRFYLVTIIPVLDDRFNKLLTCSSGVSCRQGNDTV